MLEKYILKEHEVVVAKNLMEWALWVEETDRQVKLTYIGDVRISTVFLALNLNYNNEGLPLVFETYVFGGVKDGYIERYVTWNGAEEGHDRIVDMVKGLYTYIMKSEGH